MRGLRRLVAVLGLGLVAVPLSSARAGQEGGIGVLGDSYSDEYQFYTPDRCTSRNWVEFLATTRGLNFGRFNAQGWGEPRNQGYEYNWARSDATSEDLIRTGQHTGLAAQVARGEISLVVIFIGGNDFIHALDSPDPAAALEDASPRCRRNFGTIVQTILAAGRDVKIIVSTVPDIRELPCCARTLRSGRIPPDVAERYTAAITEYNAQIRALALKCPRVALVDFDLIVRLARCVDRHHVRIAGRKLIRDQTGNDTRHLFLKDDRHIGTIAQGLMAQMIVSAANAKFRAGITPIGDRDIVVFAGERPLSAEQIADLRAVETIPSVANTSARSSLP